MREYNARTRPTARERRTEFVRALKDKPCVDCGGIFPSCAMDFDHRDPSRKIANVSKLAHSAEAQDKILREIAKCDLVCANCHRVRTYNRQRAIKPGER